MTRRILVFMCLLPAVLLPAVSIDAQQTGKILRIGFLDGTSASGTAILVDAFRQKLSKLGWIEGKSITIEYRFAEQKRERLPELAAAKHRLPAIYPQNEFVEEGGLMFYGADCADLFRRSAYNVYKIFKGAG